MASIEFTERWLIDERRSKLVERIGEIATDGTAYKLWRMAFIYYKLGELIPTNQFDRVANSQAFLEEDLAERHPDGIYIRGSRDLFKWYDDGLNQRSDAGKKSAEARRLKFGSAVPVGATNAPPPQPPSERPPNENRTEPNESEPSSSSSSSSPSQIKLGSKSSRPASADRGGERIYNSAGELKAGIGSRKLADWFVLYPDAKFLEDEIPIVWQYYDDRPKRFPGTRDAWITAVAKHFKLAWEARKNLKARDALLAGMNSPPGAGAAAKASNISAIITGVTHSCGMEGSA